MKNYEEFLTIKAKIDELRSQLPGLKNELLLKERAQPKLDEAAEDAKALEEKGWQKKEAVARDNAAAVIELQKNVAKIERWVAMKEKDADPARETALKELREHFRPRVEVLVKEFCLSLRAALEIEKKIVALEDESQKLRGKVTPYARIIVPPTFRFLLPGEGPFEYGPLGLHFKSLKEDGFDIGEEKQDVRR